MLRAMPAPAAPRFFDDAADYDRFMGRWSRLLAPAFVAFASPGAAETALDVGCGTGALIDALAPRLPGCRLTGIDLSAGLLEACRERFPPPRFHFECADAAALPFPDASFGATLSLLVLMLLDDPGRAAAEMKRVTRAGGIVAACTWDADRMELISVVWDEARALDAGAPWQAGRTHCAQPGALQALWREAGMQDVRETAIDLTLRFESFDDFWEPLAAGVGPAGAYVARAPEAMRARLRERLERRLTGERGDRGFLLGARALAVRGRVS
jgi:ubiquinone/menaquinone biosynthesis C-methylase UbiE